MKRTQIYLDEDAAEELIARAAREGVTASHLIREAIEEYLAGPTDESLLLARQRAALEEAFGTVPRLVDGATYVEGLRAADAARERDLEKQWQR